MKTFGVLTAGSALSGCASLDRWVMGEEAENLQRVVILGAGLAGLSAAYSLKKSRIPFLLFEGSSRVGGRMYSLTEFNSASQVAEMGGEWILPGHDSILQLCRDLNLELTEKNWSASDFNYLHDGKFSERKKMEHELARWLKELHQRQAELFGRTAVQLTAFNSDELAKAKAVDSMNAEEFLKSFHLPSDVLQLVALALQTRYGASTEKLSGLSIFSMISGNSASFPTGGKAWRVTGGSSAVTQALADRIAGVIPGRYLQLRHELVAIDFKDGIYELHFRTPFGNQVVRSKYVICALPLNILKGINGYRKLPLPDLAFRSIEEIGYGQLAKGALGFLDRPWKKNYEATRFWSSSEVLYLEVEPRSDRPVATPKSVLSIQLGGSIAKTAGPSTLLKAATELSSMKMSGTQDEPQQIFSWATAKWTQGGLSYWPPGAAGRCGGGLADTGLGWQFAGEHSSLLFQGTMNGALESSQNAVRKILQFRSKA